MKCLLCNFNAKDKNEIKNHYINFHNVDKDNKYFRRLIEKKNNVFTGKKCSKCDDFIPTTGFKISHDFLKHYDDGKEHLLDDEKPISIVNIGNSIKKYEITFQDHSSSYDFYNSTKLVDEFLTNVKNLIKRRNQYFIIRCGF